MKGDRTQGKNKSSPCHWRSTSQAISQAISFVLSLWDLESTPSIIACNPYTST
jgi:hypothetical protein